MSKLGQVAWQLLWNEGLCLHWIFVNKKHDIAVFRTISALILCPPINHARLEGWALVKGKSSQCFKRFPNILLLHISSSLVELMCGFYKFVQLCLVCFETRLLCLWDAHQNAHSFWVGFYIWRPQNFHIPPLVTYKNQLILFLLSAFWGPPFPLECGRHIWKPP